MRTGTTDAGTALLLAARTGDADAAESFIRLTQNSVQRFCAHLADPQNAPDLAQETYARAFSSISGFKGRSTALTWLLGIARHACADHFRVAARRPATQSLDEHTGSHARAGGDLAEHAAIVGLVNELVIDRREAFVLTQLLGLSYEEAAAVCNCPVGTIRSRVARARHDLVQAFESAQRDEATG